MTKSRQFFWIGFTMCLTLVVLVTGCSARRSLPTQTAASPSPTLTFTPSPQPTLTSLPPSPTPTLTSPPQPTATPALPSPTPTFTPSPQPTLTPSPFLPPTATPTLPLALPSGVELLASVPISIPLGGVGLEYSPIDWSPDGTVLAYGWGGGIWVARPPTYEPSLLVSLPEAGQTREVSWSPGGQYLAFYGKQPLEELWGGFIWVVKADGTGLKNLTPGEPFDPYRRKTINQWLDDHTLTIDLWHGTGAQSLWQVDTTSGEVAQLIGYGASAIPVQAYGGSYDWSPTQEHIAVNHVFYGHLVLVDVAQASEIWFSTMEDPPSERFLGWSQDGRWFLYTRWDADEERDNLWLWDVEQGKSEKLLPSISQAVFSPDGSQVVFLQQEDHPWQPPGETSSEVSSERELPALTLGLLDLATGKTVLYGPAGYKAQEVPREFRYWQPGRPAWSSDGELIVYWGEEGDVWATSADGAWQERLTQGPEIVQVLWSPDGGKLALRSFDHAWIVERPSFHQVP